MLAQGRGFERSASSTAWKRESLRLPARRTISPVTTAIVGARRPDQIEGTIAAASFVLSDSEYQQLRNFAETTVA